MSLLATAPALLLSVSLLGFGGGGGAGVAQKAKAYEGRPFKAGQSAQCANFVAEVVRRAGVTAPPPAGASLARSWLKWGRPVPLAAIRPGDVVVCWRGSRSGNAGHILIYVGGGECIHRSTQSKPVGRVPLAYYEGKILGVRRG